MASAIGFTMSEFENAYQILMEFLYQNNFQHPTIAFTQFANGGFGCEMKLGPYSAKGNCRGKQNWKKSTVKIC